MTPTSEERREVAGALRENAGKHGVTLDYMGSRQAASWWLLLHTIGCDSIEQEVAFNTLADLIDPTWQARRQTPSGGSSARQMTTTTGGGAHGDRGTNQGTEEVRRGEHAASPPEAESPHRQGRY